MTIASGFHIYEHIMEAGPATVQRARSRKANHPVILWGLRKKQPTKSDKARFFKEYKTIQALTSPAFVRVMDIVEDHAAITLVTEDWRGRPLKEILKERRFDVHDFLTLGVQLADALEYLHGRGIYHGNINPRSIIVDESATEIKLMDFGINALITGSRTELNDDHFIHDILPYLSPEQTGRVSRNEDYRSDLYALGITLFEMLTGVAPFRSQDPLELIHCHIARPLEAPELLVPDCPQVLADILFKLTAKAPEERYQSAYGLKADLQECLGRLDPEGRIEPIEIARKDIPLRFIIPQKLYGRKEEVRALLTALENVSRGNNALVLVNGASGVGKSTLIHKIQKPVLAGRGYFVKGKYEHYKTDSPYSAIIQAFKGLLSQILVENEDAIHGWRQLFLDTLGPNVGVLTAIFPELGLITGDQPSPPPVGPEEARNRFNLSFEAFVSVFLTKKRPLVLFLDDLQWADFSSLNLLHDLILSADLPYLFMVLTYRSDEVSDDHPFIDMIREATRQGAEPETITLAPLTADLIGDMIADFLKCPMEKARVLSERIFSKTAGNPFFINQFLKTLHEENIIRFIPQQGWCWNDEDIASMKVTDNVLHLMAGKISKLPEKTLEILKLSSCIGNRFDLDMLGDVTEMPLDQILTDLGTAIDQGYIHHRSDRLLFHHDRIQEAAYSLIPEKEKAAYHLKIGERTLSKAVDPSDYHNKLFYITDQLNLAAPLILDPEKEKRLFNLNVAAGKKAIASAAFNPALSYFTHAETHLNRGNLDIPHLDTLELYTDIAEASCLNGDYARMDTYVSRAMDLSPPMAVKAAICNLEIRSHFARQNYDMALKKGRDFIALFGVHIPARVTDRHLILEHTRVKLKLKHLGRKGLESLPPMTDPIRKIVAKIYFEMGISANLADTKLYGLLVLKRLHLVLVHGLPTCAALSFLGYGAFLASVLGDLKNAIAFSDLALTLADRPDHRPFRHKALAIYSALISHWKEPLDSCRAYSIQAYRLSRQAGDQICTSMALIYRDYVTSLTTSNFNELRKQIKNRLKITRKHGQLPLIQFHSMMLQLMEHITGNSPDPTLLSGEYFKEEEVVPEWIETGYASGLAHYYSVRVTLLYFAHRYEEAQKALDRTEPYKKAVKGLITEQLTTYFGCLVPLARIPSMTPSHKHRTLSRVKRLLEKIKAWSRIEPSKHQPWIFLIRAELAAVQDRHAEAPALYDQSIEAFDQAPSPMYRCLALLRAGLYYHSQGRLRSSRAYLADAMAGLKDMGLNLIHTFYKNMWKKSILSDISSLSPEDMPGLFTTSHHDSLDFSSILKSSQALSGEIVLDKLVKTLMTLSLESAGAQRGFLILSRNGTLMVKAHGCVNNHDITLMETSPENEKNRLSLQVINYVVRTHEPVVLGQACMEGNFVFDPHIRKDGVKSLLAAPIISSGEFKGIIYLENNLAPKVFSRQRIRILDVLASQAAISLENARLFQELKDAENNVRQFNVKLEKKVEERTAELKNAYEQIKVMAHTDPLTGLSNRRIMVDKIKEEVIRFKRSRQPFSLVIGDIDHFKSINDTHGHDCGDYVLVALSETLVATLREEDTVARWGGEEFLFLLPMTRQDGAMVAMEKIRRAIGEYPFQFNGTLIGLTMTFGISVYDGKSREHDIYLKQADDALYRGKQNGRNQITVY